MNLGWRIGTQVHSLADEPGAKSEDEELKGETEGGMLDCLVCALDHGIFFLFKSSQYSGGKYHA